MCTEFLLAALYFIILFFVNFLLFQLIKSYFKDFFFFLHLQYLFRLSQEKKNYFFSVFLLPAKQSFFFPNFRKKELINSYYGKDILILGNIAKTLSLNSKLNKEKFYYQLIENQYLSKKKILK